ncbi:MAG TPA: 23S rRNA (pseudouridine(1915)-N(3))-methyltransferase RlmH [Kofleriaceae bacterium]|nr:23S rRNA (pseudouridine(1915)-N(3))-methyltransferase RlmH [Kofleriaceae bacterium]
MKIGIYAVGKLKESYLQAAEAEYLKRLRPYARVTVVESRTDDLQLGAIGPRAHLYLLDEGGELVTSEGIARDILGAEASSGGGAEVAFAIGGPDGHPAAIRARAARPISFGRITIAHRLVRVLLLEQIYRGFRILRGEPYHRP